jgi:hypothetical protein
VSEAIERELAFYRERAGAPRKPMLGCSTISHDRLGYCYGCTRTLRDGGPNGAALEVMGWRLLALRDAAAKANYQPTEDAGE